jgi:hypothetical protein
MRSSTTCSGAAAQLVAGLAPVMGWVQRARCVRAHRRSVQRWLDDLEVAGLVTHERDGDGRSWRTRIVLLAADSRPS